jgi:protein phosphatase
MLIYVNSIFSRLTLRHYITKSIGFDYVACLDQIRFDLQAGDNYLLCSDGLTDMVSDRVITTILSRESNLENKTRALVQKALDKGGRDNVTVILVE